MFCGLLQKDLFIGKWSLAKFYFKQDYYHARHTRFAVFFPVQEPAMVALLTIS